MGIHWFETKQAKVWEIVFIERRNASILFLESAFEGSTMRRQLILRVVLCFVVGGLCFLVMNFFFVLKAVPSADHVEPSDTGLERNLNGDQFYWRHTALDFAVSPDGSLVAASIRTEPMHPFTNSDSRVVVIDARSCKLARE